MAIIQIYNDGNFGPTIDPGVPLVQIAASWGDWVDMPYIQPLQASLMAAPSMGQATFLHRYGLIQHEDANTPVWVQPLALAGYFIRILLYIGTTNVTMWVGIVGEQEYKPFGSSTGNPAGDQIITAYTLDYCLDRIAIIGAYTVDGYINTCPQFNLRRDWIPHPVGNKSAFLDENGVPQFGPDKEQWTARDVLDYLLAHYAEPAGMSVFIGGLPAALDSWHYVWPLEGLTLRQAFDKLIDRRRGLGWWMRSDGVVIELVIYTTIESDINFPAQYTPDITIGAVNGVGGVTIPGKNIPAITIPGNANQITYSWDTAILVDNPIIATTESNRYDSIIVQGARMMSTFTIGTADGTLTPMWTPEDEAQYAGIAQSDTTYTMTSDMVRAQDRWKHIYQLFGIRADWNWMINGYPVAPQFDNNAYIIQNNQSGPVYNDINRPFQRITRLPRPYTAFGPFAGNVQYMEPQVFATPAPSNATYPLPPNTTLPSGQSVIRGDLAGYVGGNVPPFSVTMSDIAPAIEINAGLPHIMGAADYPSGTDTQQQPWYDWRTIMATLCIETDIRPTVRVDMQPDSPCFRTLHIEVPHAEFWWLTPGTIVYQNPDLSLNIAGGYSTRDDTEILRQVAALAKAWYGVRRTPISWSEKNYLLGLSPGQMIVSASSSNGAWVDVNTVITAVTWDFQTMTSHVMTGYGELDASIVLDIPGMSDFASVGRAFNTIKADMQQTKSQVASIPNRIPPVTNNGNSVVLAQVTAVNADGTVNADLYENGTFDATGNQLSLTESVIETFNSDNTVNKPGVIPEYFSAPPSVGSWLAVIKANGNWYTINAPTPAAGTGIAADFFVDMFDRADSGVLNGNWSGILNAYDIVSGAMKYVLAGTVISAASVNNKNYTAKIALTSKNSSSILEVLSTRAFYDNSGPSSDGFPAYLYTVNTNATNPTSTSTLFRFGDGNLFTLEVFLWEDADSFVAMDNALLAYYQAMAPAIRDYEYARNGSSDTNYYNSFNTAIAVANSVASSTASPGKGDAFWTSFRSWNSGAMSIAVNDFGLTTVGGGTGYLGTAVAARGAAMAAYNSAISALGIATYCTLRLATHLVTCGTVINQCVANPKATNFDLNTAVSGNTINVSLGSASITYTDVSVSRNFSTLSIANDPAAFPTAQINAIKIYRGDMPEPPDQSGYGKYIPTANVKTQYKDKYHTPNKDSKGVITGYTYNPNA